MHDRTADRVRTDASVMTQLLIADSTRGNRLQHHIAIFAGTGGVSPRQIRCEQHSKGFDIRIDHRPTPGGIGR